MKLSEELVWRGFQAETTIKDLAFLDEKPHKFYFGADPSADSLTIGNLAALMMCACFTRHGYTPYLLAGGATGQIGDPKETGERDLKPLSEVEHNKACIGAQMKKALSNACPEGSEARSMAENLTLLDNYDWFKNINYLEFLREVGKTFSMTQLLDRQFIQMRIGEGGSGISYAEFSYTLIQGYDFLHLYREHGIDLQLCGADQFGNCSSGIHLIKRLEGGEAHVWSTPLVIDPVSGRKFGKSEGNAIWLAASDNGSGNFTSVFDFYQFWLRQSDEAVEYLMKIYTVYDKEYVEKVMQEHALAPEKRVAQKALARGVTEVVHGKEMTEAVALASEKLFDYDAEITETDLAEFAKILPVVATGTDVLEALVSSGLAASKTEGRNLLKSGAISLSGVKITEEGPLNATGVLKRGKNRFSVVK